jgi:hypothetical protein
MSTDPQALVALKPCPDLAVELLARAFEEIGEDRIAEDVRRGRKPGHCTPLNMDPALSAIRAALAIVEPPPPADAEALARRIVREFRPEGWPAKEAEIARAIARASHAQEAALLARADRYMAERDAAQLASQQTHDRAVEAEARATALERQLEEARAERDAERRRADNNWDEADHLRGLLHGERVHASYDAASDSTTALKRRLDEARAVIEPFAKAAKYLERRHDPLFATGDVRVLSAQFHAAYTFLTKEPTV